MGLDWPAAPGKAEPPGQRKFGLRADLQSGILLDIALSDVSSSTNAQQRQLERQLVPRVPGTVPQDVVEIDSEPEPLPPGLRWVRLEHHPCLSAYQRHSTAYLG